MNTVGNWVEQAAPSAPLHGVLSSVWSFLLPVEHAQKSTLAQFTVGALQNMAHAEELFAAVRGLVTQRRHESPRFSLCWLY